MVINPIQIFKSKIFINNKRLQFQGGGTSPFRGGVAMKRVVDHGDMLDCRL